MKTARCALLLVVLLVAACGGGGSTKASSTSSSSSSSSGSSSDGSSSDSSASSSGGADGELPQFISDFDRVCTTQVGFSGATKYQQVAGVHPMVFFEDFRGGDLIESSRTFPEGWVVKQDTNFSDNSELSKVEVIACSKRGELKPTGQKCEFDSDGTKVTLELVDATYNVTVFAAVTGEKLAETTLQGSSGGECPVIATFQKGDTTYVAEPEDDTYVNALKAFIQA